MINFIRNTDVSILMVLFIILPTFITCTVLEIISRIKKHKSLFF